MYKKQWYSNHILLYKCDGLNQDLMEETKPVATEKKRFEYRYVSIVVAISGISEHQDHNPKAQKHQFLNWVF